MLWDDLFNGLSGDMVRQELDRRDSLAKSWFPPKNYAGPTGNKVLTGARTYRSPLEAERSGAVFESGVAAAAASLIATR